MVRTRSAKRSNDGQVRVHIPCEREGALQLPSTSGIQSHSETFGGEHASISALPTTSETQPHSDTSGDRYSAFNLSITELKSIYSPTELKLILESDEEFLQSDNNEFDEGSESEEDSDSNDEEEGGHHSEPEEASRKWTSEKPDVADIPFGCNPGLTCNVDGDEPINFFKLIFTDEITTLCVNETNKFAIELRAKATTPAARIRNWKPLGVEEFLTWLGLLFHMRSISLARLSDYWSTDTLFNLPIFRSCMSRDRFCSILACLHFNTNDPTEIDRLHKIRPLQNLFHETMDNVYVPTRTLCIDESMMLWRGRLLFRVYIKGKRHKYGVKLYMLTEPNGLVLRFIVYAGASDKEVGGKGHTEKVVHKLLEGKLDRGYSLFMDNYYNSVNLVHELLQRGTYVTGTLRTNRKENPASIVSAKLEKNEVAKQFTDDGICVFKWRDRRGVLMISSEFGADMIDTTNHRGVTKSKPEAVVKYNEAMGGIDHADQMMSYYPIERKTLKWYKKLGIHIFHMIMINSYILYKKQFPLVKKSIHDYRLEVTKSLIFPSYNQKITRNPRFRQEKSTEQQTPAHVPVLFPSNTTKSGKSAKIRKR